LVRRNQNGALIVNDSIIVAIVEETPMPRYYFHSDGGIPHRDRTGVLLDGPDHACAFADWLATLAGGSGERAGERRITVTDECGDVVVQAPREGAAELAA
jgi:hypothetical protein